MLYSKDKLELLRKRWETAHGQKMVKIIKESRCFLNPQLFREYIKRLPFINDEEVRYKVDLRGINLEGYDFRPHIKKENRVIIGKAILNNIHFEGANLQYVQFSDSQLEDCRFEDTDLTHTKFKDTILTDCNFEKVNFYNTNFRNAKFIRSNFIDSTFRDAILVEATCDQQTSFGKIIEDEKMGYFQIASLEYKQIKEIYRKSSLFKQADDYHYREMVCKRKTLKWYNPVRSVDYVAADLLCKYGDSLLRPVIFTMITILIFALSYYFFNGIEYVVNRPNHLDFMDAIYFSISTFTTLGLGDWTPVGIFKIITGLEALMGSAIVALLTVILAKKIIRD